MLVRTAAWLALYVVLLLVGRSIVLPPSNLSLVTPATGVGLVWLASARSTRQAVLDAVLLTVASMVVLAATGGVPAQVALLVINPLQYAVAILVMRRLVPGTWGTGGRRPFRTPGEFGRLLVAFALGSLVHAVVRTGLGLLLVDVERLSSVVGRFGRSFAAMATVGVALLLVGGWVASRRDRGEPVVAAPSGADALHAVGIVSVTSLVLFVSFVVRPEAPSTYLLTLAVVWTGLRFDAVLTALFCLVVGSVAVWLTILGIGPIAVARVATPEGRALLAEVLVVVLMVTGMAISLSRGQALRTMAALAASERSHGLRAAELDLMLGRLGDGVAIVEEGGHYIRSNEALRDIMTGRRHTSAFTGDVPPTTAYHLHHPDGRPLGDDEYPYLRAIEGTEVNAQQVHVRRPGSTEPDVVEISAYPLEVEDGDPRRALVVVRDVTEERAHQDSLVAFASTVAHDLGNPLNVIDGWAELLEQDLGASTEPDAAAGVPMVRQIRTSVQQSRAFIADLLAHARARDQTLRCERVALQTLVEQVARSRGRPEQGGEVVAGELSDVWGDRLLLRQVLDNLVGNAFKYVAPGVVPRVEVTTEAVQPGWVKVAVRDNGIGIAPAHRQRVFDTFHRVSEGGYSGTGLGLAICQRVVQRHGGSIWVEAHHGDTGEGTGSSFEFTLPTHAAALERS